MRPTISSNSWYRVVFLVTCLAVPLAGCENAPSGSKAPGNRDAGASPSAVVPGQAEGPSKPTTPVELTALKHEQLIAAVKAQRGKVVVIDVWASWCLPCKQQFPHLVELHQRHAKDGVVCMSVTIDTPEQRDLALAFLQSKAATFPNYLLDEGEGAWDKLDLKSIPAVFVFDRDGKRAGKFTNDDPDNQFTYADVEKLVVALLGRPSEPKQE